jgi:hypothetical protein
MSSKWVIILLLWVLPQSGNSCDVCGCAIVGQSIGILPKFNNHLIGLRYTYKSFSSYHPSLLASDVPFSSQEYFHATEIWSRIALGKRWQLFGFVPYSVIVKQEENQRYSNSGLGDINMLAMYSILHNHINESGRFIQNLQIGGGLKLPTGKTNFITDDDWVASIQNGTGSWDFFINANYIGRWDKTGYQIEVNYRYNTPNKNQDFLFGQRAGSSFRLFYALETSFATIMPAAGFIFEYAAKNRHSGLFNDFSGGYAISGIAGIEIFKNHFGLGIHTTLPIEEQIGQGNVHSNWRLNTHLTYFF